MKIATIVCLLAVVGGRLARAEVPVVIPRASIEATDAAQRATNRRYLAVVREEVERAKRARKPRPVTIHARSSFGYGCSCIPFMFDPIRESGEDGFWPRYGSAPPMPRNVHGPFRLTGHFEPELKTGYQVWGSDAPSAGDEDPSAALAPVFAVTSWCWDLTNREVPDVASWQVEDVAKMVDEKNVCASAAQLKLLRRRLQSAR